MNYFHSGMWIYWKCVSKEKEKKFGSKTTNRYEQSCLLVFNYEIWWWNVFVLNIGLLYRFIYKVLKQLCKGSFLFQKLTVKVENAAR